MIGELAVTAPEHLVNHWAHVLQAKSLGGKYHPSNIAPSHARCNWLVGTDDLNTVMRQFFGDATGERTRTIRSILARQADLYTELLSSIKTQRVSNPDVQAILVRLALRIRTEQSNAVNKLNSKDTILKLVA